MGCCQTSQETNPKPKETATTPHFEFHSKGLPRDKYTFIRVLGKSGLGTVVLVENKITGVKRALKEIPKIGLSKSDEITMLREVSTLSAIDHPNIMKIYEMIESPTSYNIITELIEGGELLDMIVSEKKLSEKLSAKFMYDTMSAISYCHSQLIVHRDLRPQNLLLTSKGPEASIKVIDFGIADKLNKRGKITEVAGTVIAKQPLFMSPEMFAGSYDEKCDIWSSGVILFIMLTGSLPFTGNSVSEIKAAVENTRPDFETSAWTTISEECKDLVKSMLEPNPSKRLSANQVLNHVWFKLYKEGTLSDQQVSIEALINLSKYHASNKLQKSILNFISDRILDENSKKELTELFRSIDKNSDGKISREEIIDGYKELGLSIEYSKEILKSIDADHSKTIEYNEFITASLNWKKVFEKDDLENTFKIYNVGSDGILDLNELKILIPGIDNSEWESFFRDADKNNDGVLTFAEFKEYLVSRLG